LDTRVQVYAVDIGILACGPGALISDFLAAVEVYGYSFTKPGMLWRSPISRLAEAAFSLPCSLTNVSRRSCRRPTAITFEPSLTSRLAMACPIPDVAPITSTCLYNGADIFKMCFRGLINCFGRLEDSEKLASRIFVHRFLAKATSLYGPSAASFDTRVALSPEHLHPASTFRACLGEKARDGYAFSDPSLALQPTV
jgi:hypothetical protein